jgi:hypothetical protein
LGTDNVDVKQCIKVSFFIPLTNIIIGVFRTVSNSNFRVDFDKYERDAGRLEFARLFEEEQKYY